MSGQVDMAGHPEVGLGLLLVMATVIPAADDIALVALMTAHGIGVVLVLSPGLDFWEHLPSSLRLLLQQQPQSYECVFLCYIWHTKMDG